MANDRISSSLEALDLLSPRRWAFLASFSVFYFGFGALNIFTILGSGQPHLPGLYSFRSATIGDGLLLPLLAYSLIRSAGLHRPRSRYQIAFSVAGGTVGALAGMAVEAQALIDPDPRLDWTFPAPHSYNLPGWYHAGFLIVASGFFGWALALVLARIREEALRSAASVHRRIRSEGSLGVLTPGLAFVGLLIEDDLSGNPAVGFVLSAIMAGLGILLCVALCWACGRRNLRWCVQAVLGSLLPAIALCALFLPGHTVSLSSVVSAVTAGLAGFFGAGSIRSISRNGMLCVAICAAGPVFLALAGKPVTISCLAIGCFAGLLLASCELAILHSLLPPPYLPGAYIRKIRHGERGLHRGDQ